MNEQWPDYWAALFKTNEYLPIDCIRGRIWGNEQVELWYAQNILLFASADRIREDSDLRREYEKTNPQQLSLVHPRRYLEEAAPRPFQYGVRFALRLLGQATINATRRRIRRVLPGERDTP